MLLACCGYTTRTLLPPHLKTIAIPVVENQTIRPGLGELLTEKLIEDFTKDRNLRVTSIEKANIVLECKISNFEKTPQAYDVSQEVYAYRIVIDVSGRCEDRVLGEVIWEEKISTFATYDPDKEPEDEGIKRALEKISLEVLRKTLIAW